MTDRNALIRSFLTGTKWANAQRTLLAGDASNRRYERLTDTGSAKTVVLMDAPPNIGESTRPFLRIAQHLHRIGFSSPEILARDIDAGLLLIEDLGDDLFARIIPCQPDLEPTLYTAATDVLLALHQMPVPELVALNAMEMAELTSLAFSSYRAGIIGNTGGEPRFRTMFRSVLEGIAPEKPVLVLRDYHAENLLWLPDRSGVARVGLLDFQDAMSGHPAYDLVSLLPDARRDVPKTIEEAMIKHYVDRSGFDLHAFQTAYAVLGAQRNLRILGVFARLSLEHGKQHYVDLIPRVWAHLQRDLQHPALVDIAQFLQDALPEPTTENLQRLKP